MPFFFLNNRFFSQIQNPPPYERLVGDLKNCYSIRINIQHRLVYKVNEKEKRIQILSMW